MTGKEGVKHCWVVTLVDFEEEEADVIGVFFDELKAMKAQENRLYELLFEETGDEALDEVFRVYVEKYGPDSVGTEKEVYLRRVEFLKKHAAELFNVECERHFLGMRD